MNDFISWYNQNRKKIWITIITVFIIGLVIWRLINMTFEGNENIESGQTTQINTNELNSITISTEESAITGNAITTSNEGLSAINSFISFCNSGKIQEAYNLISKECKEEKYPNINYFNELYYKSNFEGKERKVNIENWFEDTYLVEYKDDILSTGIIESEQETEDYITVVRNQEGNYSLNIGKFIKRQEIGKIGSWGNISIKVLNKNAYIDYEIYEFEVTNSSLNQIALCNVNDSNASYLLDSNNLEYIADINELAQLQVLVRAGETKKIRIKYLNKYNTTRQIENIVFSRILLNYDLVENNTNNSNYTSINIAI